MFLAAFNSDAVGIWNEVGTSPIAGLSLCSSSSWFWQALEYGMLGAGSTYTWIGVSGVMDFSTISLALRQHLQGTITIRTNNYDPNAPGSIAFQSRVDGTNSSRLLCFV